MSNEAMVIVGAGHAARRAAESLRQISPGVRVLMLGDEPELPYDRPLLSKDALTSDAGEQRAFIRAADWYVQQRIEMRLGVRVQAIDRAAREVRLDDGSRIGYARLLLATGSRVRRFSGPVAGDAPVHYVRTVADARGLRAALAAGRRIVVLGGGFIGLEVAAAAVSRGCKVTLVEPAGRLLQRSMPPQVSAFMLALHAARGVEMRVATQALGIRCGARGTAMVETDRGEIEADAVVVGIGVVPNLELAQAAGLAADNGVLVDAQCRTSDPSIFAAGEVTNHFNPLLGRHIRIESWQVAENQPAVAAANMLGGEASYAETPWLWSDQYDCNLQTLGVFGARQTITVRGNPAGTSFSVLAFGEDDKLEAVASVNGGRDIAACRRLIAAGKVLDRARIADAATPLRTLL
ncbi:anthranilate 1,2-dioxygenase system ferredoxin--NAD(+) reductase [Cupriavidus sp. 2TAF22]|uniref:anthranilate 1,2-dioxygenase system ferredoxin--NAD(+) reductase n=1 Tax=unclassified Cupriavidus TaxID=2640874 RepID=UPI003F92B83D